MYSKNFFSDQRTPAVEPQTAFVIMPFAGNLVRVYEAIEKAVLEDVGYASCRRADDLSSGHIMSRVLDGIARAEVVIADVTERNPNVFYELGIAHTVKDDTKVIIIGQSMKDVPFDISEFKCILYSADDIGLARLKTSLAESVRAATPARFRFPVDAGKSHAYRGKLRGQDRSLYTFEVGPVLPGYNFADFRVRVLRLDVDKPPEEVSNERYTRDAPDADGFPVPFLNWLMKLDAVVGERAFFCLCEPPSEARSPTNY